jgi:hypothetical protein
MPTGQILAIDFNGTIIPFVSRITYQELTKYHDFLNDFLQDPSRKPETLNKLTDSQDLYWAQLKTKSLNFKKWIVERTNRGLFGIAFATVGTALTMQVLNEPSVTPVVSERAVVDRPIQDIGKLLPPATQEFVDSQGHPVQIYTITVNEGSATYLFLGDGAKRYGDLKSLTLKNSDGVSQNFEIAKMANGVPYLVSKVVKK